MDKQIYRSTEKKTLFDGEFSTGKLSEIGNPLEKMAKVIYFEILRSLLEDKLLNRSNKNNAGAKPFDVVLMFKIMVLQRYYGLGNKQVEYQILDISFLNKYSGGICPKLFGYRRQPNIFHARNDSDFLKIHRQTQDGAQKSIFRTHLYAEGL